MALKGLNQFVPPFEFERFAAGKEFEVTGVSDWVDYEDNGKLLGTKVETTIIKDMTQYEPDKAGNPITNKYQQIVFKVGKGANFPLGTKVVAKGVTATIYGEYRNQLSVKCEDIVEVKDQKAVPMVNTAAK